jgi:hypothetical protein
MNQQRPGEARKLAPAALVHLSNAEPKSHWGGKENPIIKALPF